MEGLKLVKVEKDGVIPCNRPVTVSHNGNERVWVMACYDNGIEFESLNKAFLKAGDLVISHDLTKGLNDGLKK